MPAPVLRRYSRMISTGNTFEAVVPVMSTGRAFVVSRLVLSNQGAAAGEWYVQIGPTGQTGGRIFGLLTLQAGQMYVESGLVVPSGEGLWVLVTNGNNVHHLASAFGEEVDN